MSTAGPEGCVCPCTCGAGRAPMRRIEDDLTCLAIEGWIESSRLHNERVDLLDGQLLKLALVLTELRRNGLAEQVDRLVTKHGMTVQWDVLWRLHMTPTPPTGASPRSTTP